MKNERLRHRRYTIHRMDILSGALVLVLFLTPAGWGTDTTSKFLSVSGPCALTFPEDHGPHHGYRTEWWYYTGNLKSKDGARFGFQLTFFRRQILPPGSRKGWPRPASAWRTDQIYMAHAAVSDMQEKRHFFDVHTARAALGIAGCEQSADATTLFLKKWSARIGPQAHLLKASSEKFSMELSLEPLKPPVPHGRNGCSAKGSTPGRASCYYSITRLKTRGILAIAGRRYEVDGLSWMDHEFSTAMLEPGIVGWDWFSLQLTDGTDVMVFLLRLEDGGTHPASSGTIVDPAAGRTHLHRGDFDIAVRNTWKSPHSGARYPSGWRIKASPLSLDATITPGFSDQEVRSGGSTGVTYWEGSVSVKGTSGGNPVAGWGYVELTGYAAPFASSLLGAGTMP